jgi:hypothetical protein
LQRGRGSFIENNRRQTKDNQKLTNGGFNEGVSMSCPCQPSPKRHNLPLGSGGGGGRIRYGAERKGRGCNYHEVDDDDDDNNDDGKGWKQGKKY